MSTLILREIQCPRCGNKQEVAMWDSINVTLEPEMKEKFITGEIFQFECKECKLLIPVAYPILYHDVANHLMIWLLNEGEETEGLNDVLPNSDNPEEQQELSKYRYRIVSGISEMVDKIKLFDSHYDDRVVEVLKRIMTLSIIREMPDEEILAVSYDNNEEGRPCLKYHFGNDKVAQLVIEDEMIDKVLSENILKIEALTIHGFQRIDEAWAMKILQK